MRDGLNIGFPDHSRHPDKPMMFACADCPRRGFAGSCAPTGRKGVSRGAVARLGLSTEAAERGSQEACTSEEVIRRVEARMGDDGRMVKKNPNQES